MRLAWPLVPRGGAGAVGAAGWGEASAWRCWAVAVLASGSHRTARFVEDAPSEAEARGGSPRR